MVVLRRLLPLLALGALLPLPATAQVGSPGGPVPVEQLQARRAAVLKAMRPGVAVITAAKVRVTAVDFTQDADYRESPDFFYLTGVESPDARLVLIKTDSTAEGEVRLFLTRPPAVADIWSAARTYADSIAARVTGLTLADICPIPAAGGRGGRGAAGAAPAGAPAGQCAPLRSRPATALVSDQQVLPPGVGRGGAGQVAIASPVDAVVDSFARMLNVEKLNRTQLNTAINNSRSVKDADELRRLRRASEISAEGHRAAMMYTRPGMWEYEIEAQVEYEFHRRGAERVGYPSIVGSGPNATILHYDLSRRQSQDGELVLVDAAAEFGYYTADVTRTFPVNGKFTPRQKALYELVLGAQQASMDSVRPGQTMARLQQIVREYLRVNSGTLCGERTCDTYLTHGTSHMVGLAVHDVNPGFRELMPGMAFTIEPGLYIPAESIGIRIEDVILVTATGYENLSRGAPRTVADIEALAAEGRRLRP